MGRARNPNRDAAFSKWLETDGRATTKELSELAGVAVERVRKWKSLDKWQEKLDEKNASDNKEAHRVKGGQAGNRNAAGHGAPIGNKNAETHGAYSKVHLENLSQEEICFIENLTLNVEENMLRELRLLFAKAIDLAKKIRAYENALPEEMFPDRVIEMMASKGRGENEKNKTAMKTIVKASAFDRMIKLEAEYCKTHGRILRLIDTIRAHEVDRLRADLDERRHALASQRLTGEYNIDPDIEPTDGSGGGGPAAGAAPG